MTRNEQEFYKNIERIAIALEKLVHCQNTAAVIEEYKYEKKTNIKN